MSELSQNVQRMMRTQQHVAERAEDLRRRYVSRALDAGEVTVRLEGEEQTFEVSTPSDALEIYDHTLHRDRQEGFAASLMCDGRERTAAVRIFTGMRSYRDDAGVWQQQAQYEVVLLEGTEAEAIRDATRELIEVEGLQIASVIGGTLPDTEDAESIIDQFSDS